MATLEDELRDLREKNTELAQKVQYWKMTAAQKDDEKLALMMELNELRLKLSRIRTRGGFQARNLDAALQDASEKAISNLVKASAEIAKSIEIVKTYMRERQELEAESPRWSGIGGTPNTDRSERVHRVPPMMLGGQSIQPVVALSRTMLNTSNPRSTTTRSPNQNRSVTERAVPMHMLQDVYIPLTRIDAPELSNNNNMDVDADADVADDVDDRPQDYGEPYMQDRNGDLDDLDSDDHISDVDEYEPSKLETVSEEELSPRQRETLLPEMNVVTPCRLTLHIVPRPDNWHTPPPSEFPMLSPRRDEPPIDPMEGPSWLLDDTPTNADTLNDSNKRVTRRSRKNHNPDSTMEVVRTCRTSAGNLEESSEIPRAFSPTVRRRKRTSSPPALATPTHMHYSPRPASARRNSINGRVLKVLVSKMRLDGSEGDVSSPPKRSAIEAPSPNGATDSRVIVFETRTRTEQNTGSGSQNSTRRESQGVEQVRESMQDREMPQSRLGQEHDNLRRVASEHDRRNVQDLRNSHSRGRLASQDTRESMQSSRHRSRLDSHDSRDSDSGSGGGGDSISEGRTRRPRKAPVTYKEKPLNSKLRR